jgi:hypothetical protein
LKGREPPDELRATPEFQSYYSNLNRNSVTFKQIEECLDSLRENLRAGEKIDSTKFPNFYKRKYGITNLYRMALGRQSRLLYTIIAQGPKRIVCILEYFPNHKSYDERMGYMP